MTIVLTRPKGRNGKLTQTLRQLGFCVEICPLLQNKACNGVWPDDFAFDTVIFTSPAAVEFFDCWGKLTAVRILAVGSATAREIIRKGYTVDYYPTNGAGLAALESYPDYKQIGHAVVVTQKNGRMPKLASAKAYECYKSAPANVEQLSLENKSIVLTSLKAASYLFDKIATLPAAVITSQEPIIALAKSKGVDKCIKTNSATDEDIIKSIAGNTHP